MLLKLMHTLEQVMGPSVYLFTAVDSTMQHVI